VGLDVVRVPAIGLVYEGAGRHAYQIYCGGRSMLATGGHAPACATLVTSNP
jgi:hypothetical protein